MIRCFWSIVVLFLVVSMGATEAPPQSPKPKGPPQAPALRSLCPCGPNCPHGAACECNGNCDCLAVKHTAPDTTIYRDPQTGRRWQYTPNGPYTWDWIADPFPQGVLFEPAPSAGFGGGGFAPRFGGFRAARGGC